MKDRSALDELVGTVVDFYGVNCESFCLDQRVFTAIEDPDDGYRSYLGSIEEDDGFDQLKFMHNAKIARVRVRKVTQMRCVGYELEDVDTGHVWLRFGTDQTDEWYPYFVFEYRIDENQRV